MSLASLCDLTSSNGFHLQRCVSSLHENMLQPSEIWVYPPDRALHSCHMPAPAPDLFGAVGPTDAEGHAAARGDARCSMRAQVCSSRHTPGPHSADRCLSAYSEVRVLHLERNSLTGIQNLSTLLHLRCLYLNNNSIASIQGLNTLTSLQVRPPAPSASLAQDTRRQPCAAPGDLREHVGRQRAVCRGATPLPWSSTVTHSDGRAVVQLPHRATLSGAGPGPQPQPDQEG